MNGTIYKGIKNQYRIIRMLDTRKYYIQMCNVKFKPDFRSLPSAYATENDALQQIERYLDSDLNEVKINDPENFDIL